MASHQNQVVMELGLAGTHAFVGGASRGIGLAIAESFLAEGANVSLCARNADALESAINTLPIAYQSRAAIFAADLTDTDRTREALNAAVVKFGPIDSLVANVGGANGQPGTDVSDADWNIGINQNFLGTMKLVREVVTQRRNLSNSPQKELSIVLISSIAGIDALKAPLPYSTQKAALIMATKEIAKSVGAEGIRINAVAPGNILFPGGTWEARLEARAPIIVDWIKREVALGRFGTPQEIADAVLFLSSHRSRFTTGAIVPIDGGQLR